MRSRGANDDLGMNASITRRDFLSAFMTCFLPIIGVYYPLMLCGTNLSKEGMFPPILALWLGNMLLFIGAIFVLPSVTKH